MADQNISYKKQYDSYLVREEELLYRLADAHLLDKMRRVADDRNNAGKRIWFFDKDDEVAKIFFDFKAEIKKGKAE